MLQGMAIETKNIKKMKIPDALVDVPENLAAASLALQSSPSLYPPLRSQGTLSQPGTAFPESPLSPSWAVASLPEQPPNCPLLPVQKLERR